MMFPTARLRDASSEPYESTTVEIARSTPGLGTDVDWSPALPEAVPVAAPVVEGAPAASSSIGTEGPPASDDLTRVPYAATTVEMAKSPLGASKPATASMQLPELPKPTVHERTAVAGAQPEPPAAVTHGCATHSVARGTASVTLATAIWGTGIAGAAARRPPSV